jgi:hypothetical protein
MAGALTDALMDRHAADLTALVAEAARRKQSAHYWLKLLVELSGGERNGSRQPPLWPFDCASPWKSQQCALAVPVFLRNYEAGAM